MNKYHIVLLFGLVTLCGSNEPSRARSGAIPYLVYFKSRYRGICVGTLVARSAVLTAAVCITSYETDIHDHRPITVVAGSTYRHPRRGIRVPVVKILLPNLSNVTGQKGYLMQKSVALLLLKHKVPDVMAEYPVRAIGADWTGDEVLILHEECFTAGWHYFYHGDKIFSVYKYLLQRSLRVQFVNIVKMSTWCDPLTMKFKKALSNLGFRGYIDKTSAICVKDPDGIAQACHGMYGSPLICRGRLMGLMMAPDAQWTNCTGLSNVIHLLRSSYLKKFMACVSKIFDPDYNVDWATMKRMVVDDPNNEYDYVRNLYDELEWDTSSTSEED